MTAAPPIERYSRRLRAACEKAESWLAREGKGDHATFLGLCARELRQAREASLRYRRTWLSPLLAQAPGWRPREVRELLALEAKAEQLRHLCTSAARLVAGADP